MARAVFFAALFALLALANGQACITCSSCNGNNFCLSQCKRECPPTINVETCKNYGNQAGDKAMAEACRLTLQYCGVRPQGRSTRPPNPPAPTFVSLQQCGNAAYGVCTARAADQSRIPCINELRKGNSFCDSATFQEWYKGLAESRCNQEASVFDRPQGK